jgi:hypothetical protein
VVTRRLLKSRGCFTFTGQVFLGSWRKLECKKQEYRLATHGLRLAGIFDNKILPLELRELGTCIREDGSDGVHAGTLTKAGADDLLNFTIALLERLINEPKKARTGQRAP